MNAGAWIVVGVVIAILLAGGALLTVFLFARVAPQEGPVVGPPVHHVEQPAREPAPAPMLRSPVADGSAEGAAELRRRVESLEQLVAELTAQLEETRAQIKPLLALLEHAKETGSLHFTPDGTPIIPTAIEIADSGPAGEERASTYARLMKLSPERAAAFQKLHRETLAQIQALEKEHATVSVDGDTTTIKIPRYERDGEQLRRAWSDWLGSYLTDEQADTYKKGGGTNALFGSRLGNYERTIEVKEAGGNISLSETSVSGDGEEYRTETSGPAEARDFVLEEFQHLLK